MVFSNITIYFLGSDDFTITQKREAAKDLAEALGDGWKGLEIGEIYPIEQIAEAHLHVENRKKGRALVNLK